jgi:hypothetical protein
VTPSEDMLERRGRCIFCGATDRKMSNEHVWPEWITGLLPSEVAREMVTLHFTDSHQGHVRSFPQRLFQLTVKDVCKPCNEGWMSRLEEAVKPIISGMLVGRGRELHARGQAAIAAWALLKVLVVQRSFPRESFVPTRHYAEVFAVRDEQQPPPLYRAYTGRVGWSQGRGDFGFFRMNGVQRRSGQPEDSRIPVDEVDGYLATFTVLDLVVQVFRSLDDEEVEWLHRGDLAPSMARLWPSSGTFIWPPGPSLTAAGVQAISGPAVK